MCSSSCLFFAIIMRTEVLERDFFCLSCVEALVFDCKLVFCNCIVKLYSKIGVYSVFLGFTLIKLFSKSMTSALENVFALQI